MNDQLMRTEIKKAYGNTILWSSKVDKMVPAQAQALYFRLKKAGKIK